MPVPVIQGEHVTLRPIADADLEPLAAIIREPGIAEWWGESEDPVQLAATLRARKP